MKSDIAVRAIRALRFIWREAKKPAMIQNLSLKIDLSPGKDASRPLLTLGVVNKVRLVYVLLGTLIFFHILARGIKAVFK